MMAARRGGDGGRTWAAQGRTMTDTKRGRQGHDQVSSNGDGGERRERDGQEESDDASAGWSGVSAENSAGSETEEDGMTAGRPEGRKETLKATAWGTKYISVQERYMGVRGPAGATPGNPLPRPPTRLECGTAMGRGRHEGGKGILAVKYGRQNLGSAGRRKGSQGLLSGPQVLWIRGQGGGTRGLRSGVKPRGRAPPSGRGVESPHGADTPGVVEVPWGEGETGGTTVTEYIQWEDG